MRYAFAQNINLFNSLSFRDHYELATLSETQAERVKYCADQEVPPSAPNQAQVTENCQGWTVRVIRRLIQEGIVAESWDASVVALMEAIH